MNTLLYFSITGAINFIAISLFALFVYLKNPKSEVNLRCSIFNLTVAVWAFGYIFWPLANTKQEALFWFQILHCGTNFTSITLFHFVSSFLKIKKRKLLILGYTLSLFILPFIFTPYFIKNMRSIGIFPFWGVPGPMYCLYLINFFTYAILSIFFMYKAYSISSFEKKNQLKYILAGTIAGYVSGSTNYLLFFGIPFTPYLTGLTFIYVAAFVYAIAAHKLMNITIIFRKTIVYSILATIITILYFGVVLVFENIFRIYYGYKSFPISFIVIISFLLLFQPLKNYIQRMVDKYFFHGTIAQIDEENIKLREELQKTEKLKAVATLAAGMAHEIKNPLTSIKTFTEHIPKKGDDPAFRDKFYKIVGNEVDRINYTVKQLLEFSKPSKPQLKETDINNLLDDTLNLLNNDLLKHNIKAEKTYSSLPAVKVDPSQMKQVFLNILLNAIESIHNSGVITVNTTLKKDNDISIKISDTGKGIDREDLKHIFDPFFSKKDGGTGLGLSVVHGIIKKHHGKINVESSREKGTVFEILLSVS